MARGKKIRAGTGLSIGQPSRRPLPFSFPAPPEAELTFEPDVLALLAALDRKGDRVDGQLALTELHSDGLDFISADQHVFPAGLRELAKPPQGLFIRGVSVLLSQLASELTMTPLHVVGQKKVVLPAIAIIGSRAASAEGTQAAREFAGELSKAGFAIVNGLARGIDAEAARGTLAADGVPIGISGCGIDRDYPAANSQLFKDVVRSGAVLSEYGPGVEPAPWQFLARNRLIAGLSQAVLVIEARDRSGALGTADTAAELGRPVFVWSGGNDASAIHAGSRALVAAGKARFVANAAELLALLP